MTVHGNSDSELLTVLASLQSSLPQSDNAYHDPATGWLAQRIVGAAAVIEQLVQRVDASVVTAGENTPPPPLPAGVPAFGGEWTSAATVWLNVASVLRRSESEAMRVTAERLTEYAATQQRPNSPQPQNTTT